LYELVTQVTLKVLLPQLGKTHFWGKNQTWSVAKAQGKHAAQGIQSIHPFINPPILLAITLTSQEVTI